MRLGDFDFHTVSTEHPKNSMWTDVYTGLHPEGSGQDAYLAFYMSVSTQTIIDYDEPPMDGVMTANGLFLPSNTWEDGEPQWIAIEGLLSAEGFDYKVRKA